jgi:hypothetical protein
LITAKPLSISAFTLLSPSIAWIRSSNGSTTSDSTSAGPAPGRTATTPKLDVENDGSSERGMVAQACAPSATNSSSRMVVNCQLRTENATGSITGLPGR